jgi:hypothetical protein
VWTTVKEKQLNNTWRTVKELAGAEISNFMQNLECTKIKERDEASTMP